MQQPSTKLLDQAAMPSGAIVRDKNRRLRRR